jgi:hypothetical protein
MTKSRGIRKQHKEGDIKIMPSHPNAKWRYTNGEWVYVKKPREEWNMPMAKPKKKISYDYPPIKIPSNMKETSYPGYYITEEGDAYRRPGKYDRNGQYGEINQWGLIYLKPAYRGNPRSRDDQYYCVNVSTYDEDGNYKQIKKSNHQLVAETYVPNPHGYVEVMHMDDDNRNNHYTNLKWGTHLENMEGVVSPATTPKSYKITDIKTGETWEGMNLAQWARDHYDMIVPRTRSPHLGASVMAKNLGNSRSKGINLWGFKVEFGDDV